MQVIITVISVVIGMLGMFFMGYVFGVYTQRKNQKVENKELLGKLLVKHQSDYRSHVRRTEQWSMHIGEWIEDNYPKD